MTQSHPTKLSVIVLCYNKKEEIQRFWTSLSRQTRQPDQVIVVDDCSTDAPGHYYRKIVAPCPLIRLSKNQGQGHARNVGAELATGDFIIFLDGDIEMRPAMLEKLETALVTHPDTSIAYSHYDRKGSRTDNVRAISWDYDVLRKRNFITMMSMLRLKDIPMPPFDEELERYEDWDLWLRMAKAGKSGVMVPEILFRAYYKEGDISGKGESLPWYKIVCEKHGESR